MPITSSTTGQTFSDQEVADWMKAYSPTDAQNGALAQRATELGLNKDQITDALRTIDNPAADKLLTMWIPQVYGTSHEFVPAVIGKATPVVQEVSKVAAIWAVQGALLVGIASVAGFRGIPGGGAYSASKAACITYCESLRVELKRSGVSVVTICPGYIRTPMTAVNKFKMPFLIGVDDAVERFARAVDAKTSFTVIPWTMGIAARVLRVLPNWLYDALFQRMPRKPRNQKH